VRLRLPSLTAVTAAFVLTLLAGLWFVAEPLGKGRVLLAITERHGVDTTDLPGFALLALAALVVAWPTLRTVVRRAQT
jgi:hypothetical protein